MKFWEYLLGGREALFSVLLATSMEHACVVQSGSLLFLCLSGCLFVLSVSKGDPVNYCNGSTEHREMR